MITSATLEIEPYGTEYLARNFFREENSTNDSVDAYVQNIENHETHRISGNHDFKAAEVMVVQTRVRIQNFVTGIVGEFYRNGDRHLVLQTGDVVNMSRAARDKADKVRFLITEPGAREKYSRMDSEEDLV